MANFTAGTSFTDGVTNDVTAAKLNALVADAVPTSSLALASTSGTISNFTSSTATLLGAITGSTNVINIGSGQIYKDASGNVGIGTTSPATQLQINSSAATYSDQLRIRNTNFGNADIGVGSGIMAIATDMANITFHTSSNLGTTGSSVPSNERLRIDSSGNVGIGTGGTAAASKLDVYGLGNFQGLEVGKSGQTGNRVAGIDFTGDDTYTDYGFRIIRQNTGANADTALTNRGTGGLVIRTEEAGDIVLQTTNTERMRIAAGGNIGIGTASPSAQLELSTDSAKKPSTNTWTIASDQRLKTNITNADNDRCYEIVKQVPLKRYTWRSEVYSEGQVKDRSKLGWIAQDVEAVFPKAVGTNRFAYNQVFEDVVTPELDSDGNAVLDENGVAKTKTEKRLVSEDVIEDCKDLNSDQIYAAMYGTIQKLIEKVEFLESKVATLEAA